MTNEQKTFVVTEIAKLLKKTSQNKLANKAGISSGYMSQIVKRKWDNIADATWLKVAINLGIKLKHAWKIVPTKTYNNFLELIDVARKNTANIGIAGDSGYGKTAFYEDYCKKNDNSYHLVCNDFWTKKMFAENFLRLLGEDPTGKTTAKICQKIIETLKKIPNSIVFIDEADKMGDFLALFFISLDNTLFDHTTFIVSGSPYFQLRVELNAKRDKRGYKEFYSRIGKTFIEPRPIDF